MTDETFRRIVAGDIDAYVGVITDQARAVTRSRLPHPDGRAWVDDDVDELVSEYFLSSAYRYALMRATDDDNLRALVFTALRNQVRAKLRKSVRARLRRRLREVMTEEAFIEGPEKFWRRGEDPVEAFGGRQSDLAAAAWSASVRLVRWRPDAKRNSPLAERASFVAVLDHVLDAAGGAVHEDVLVDIVGERFGVGPNPVLESLDLPDEAEPVDATPGPDDAVVLADETLTAKKEAVTVFGQLSPREKKLLPHLGASARDAADAVGGGKSAINEAQRRLKVKMQVLLGDVDDERRVEVLRELRVLAALADS